MSKEIVKVQPKMAVTQLVLQIFTLTTLLATLSLANTPEYEIKIGQGAKPFAVISAKHLKERSVVFETSVAGISGIGLRITDVKGSRDGKSVEIRTVAPGEFLAVEDVDTFSYRIDLGDLQNRSARAHASWVGSSNGILMLSDMLPIFARQQPAKLRLLLPEGWKHFALPNADADRSFVVDDVDRSIIPIGNDWRTTKAKECNARIILNGKWLFADDDAAKFTSEVCSRYISMFGSAPAMPFQVIFAKFAGNVSHGEWQAETRGANVTIISSDMPFQTGSLQRLHEQLRHEIFHLWIPNGLSLSGRYDWFYEGFALYQSLRVGVADNRISFNDLLDTLSRANSIDAAMRNRVSLIDASAGRWTGDSTMLYARGMVVAFAFDLALLDASKGKASVNNLLRDIFQLHDPPADTTDANAALRSFLTAKPETKPIYERYVSGTDLLDTGFIKTVSGIEYNAEGRRGFSVGKKLSGRQKAILNALGYNNWRKSPQVQR